MIELFRATEEDVSDVVSIHQQAFPDFFLTKLGSGFLRLYYRSVLNNKDGILLVSKTDDKEIMGFCAGTLLSSGFNARLIKAHLLSYMNQGVKLLFTHPIRILHLYRNLSKENPDVGDKGDYAELLSIGVDPNKQGGGVGKKLLIELERFVLVQGGAKLSLTTDYYDNEKAINFYHSMGYKEWYDFVTYPNRRMYRMIKKLESK